MHRFSAPSWAIVGGACAAVLALLLAWAMSIAPFSGPDEPPHYLRALSIANGQLLGHQVPAPAARFVLRTLSPAQRNWVTHDLREVDVPARMAPELMTCINGATDTTGCIETSGTGDYHPLPYLLPAAGLAIASSAGSGLWVARVLAVVSSWLFLALGLVLLWNGRSWSLLGPLIALTPMVMYVIAVLNPSGLEIASSFALTSCVLRISRNVDSFPGWIWAATAISGSVAILSWQMGPVYVVIDLALLALLLGVRSMRALVQSNRRAVAVVAACFGASLALWVGYGAASGVMHSTIKVSASSLTLGWDQMSMVLHDAVYGPAAQHLPAAANWAWWLLVVGIVMWAASTAARRERRVLIGTSLFALAFPVVFYAWVYRFSGFVLAARYVLPILMLAPLLAGELLSRRPDRVAAPVGRAALITVGAVVGAIQLTAWWRDGRASSGSAHWFRFFDFAHWSPPAGWWLWIALAVVSVASLVCVVALGPATDSRRRTARSG